MGWALRGVPARLRVFYAPLLTFALVAVSAIVLGKTGIPWSLISFRAGRCRDGGCGCWSHVAGGSPLACSGVCLVAG